jgi:hypothetical protein
MIPQSLQWYDLTVLYWLAPAGPIIIGPSSATNSVESVNVTSPLQAEHTPTFTENGWSGVFGKLGDVMCHLNTGVPPSLPLRFIHLPENELPHTNEVPLWERPIPFLSTAKCGASRVALGVSGAGRNSLIW